MFCLLLRGIFSFYPLSFSCNLQVHREHRVPWDTSSPPIQLCCLILLPSENALCNLSKSASSELLVNFRTIFRSIIHRSLSIMFVLVIQETFFLNSPYVTKICEQSLAFSPRYCTHKSCNYFACVKILCPMKNNFLKLSSE